ncbi:MAG: hypothetical protein KDB22_14395 [Planctomycetales bacterium]|nr:hypothetical protein [Planctomycetales bacterium]
MRTENLICNLTIVLGFLLLFSSPARGQWELENPFEMLPDGPSALDAPVVESGIPNPLRDDGSLAPLAQDATRNSDTTGAQPTDLESVVSTPTASGDGVQQSPEPEADTILPEEEDDQDVPADVAIVVPAVNAADVADSVLADNYSKAVVIQIEGDIFGRFRWYLLNRLAWAEQQGADLVIVDLTTPGGRLDHSLELAEALRDITWAKTIVFISKEAISGGAILSLGADRIYMTDGALFGDAGPIELGPGGQFEHASEKLLSYLMPALATLAKSKNRPAALAQALVDRNLKVYQATELKTGQTTFLTEAETQMEGVAQLYDVGPIVPETNQGRFLTLEAERARELQFCQNVFQSAEDFFEAVNAGEIVRTEYTWVDNVVYLLNLPLVSGLILIIGLIGLYFEVAAPGISVAGLTATVAFGIFFWSHLLGGTAGWLEFLLFGLGVIFIICEVFVLPGFGVFGVSGLILLVLSLVMASQDFVVPSSTTQWSQLRTNLLIVLGAISGMLILFFGQLILLDSLPGLSRFQLNAPQDSAENTTVGSLTGLLQNGAPTLANNLKIGDQGVADSDLRPSGKIRVEGNAIDVISDGDYIEKGTAVEIISVYGNRIVVRKSES